MNSAKTSIIWAESSHFWGHKIGYKSEALELK